MSKRTYIKPIFFLGLFILIIVSLAGCVSADEITPATKSEVKQLGNAMDESRETIAALANALLPDSAIARKASNEANVNLYDSMSKPNYIEQYSELIVGVIGSLILGGAYHTRKTGNLKRLARKAADLPSDEAHKAIAKHS